MAWGALTGILVGCLPGLSATLCIALLTTLTVKLPANDAILILVCSYVGTLYGGSRSAILLNIPGTAANAASCADGHALARRGEAGRAIGIATSGAFTGVLFGVFCLAALTPVLARVALSFGSYEFFWLALFGVTMSGRIVGDDPVKGWLMGLLGLFVAQIGQDGLYAHDRFNFGIEELSGGISLIPALIGAFGFSEILTTLANPTGIMVELKDSVLPRFREVAQYWQTALRSGAVGVLTGLLPGIGEDAGAWMSYAAARVFSKEAAQFSSGVEAAAHLVGPPGEAVQDGPLGHPLGRQDLEEVVPGRAGVDDQGQAVVPGQGDLLGERLALGRAGRVVVVVVEPALAHRHQEAPAAPVGSRGGVGHLLDQLGHRARPLGRLVGVEPGGGPDAGDGRTQLAPAGSGGQGQGLGRGLGPGAHADQGPHPGLDGPLQGLGQRPTRRPGLPVHLPARPAARPAAGPVAGRS